MKPSPFLTRIRQIWIMNGWLRHEAVAAAGMIVVRREEAQSKEDKAKATAAAATEELVGQSEGKLPIVRILDDYVVPFECSF